MKEKAHDNGLNSENVYATVRCVDVWHMVTILTRGPVGIGGEVSDASPSEGHFGEQARGVVRAGTRKGFSSPVSWPDHETRDTCHETRVTRHDFHIPQCPSQILPHLGASKHLFYILS